MATDTLAKVHTGENSNFSWSPNGTRLAVADDSGLHVYNVDSGIERAMLQPRDFVVAVLRP